MKKESIKKKMELLEALKAGKKPAKKATKKTKKSAFEKADKDNDGKLSKEEFKATKKEIVENEEE